LESKSEFGKKGFRSESLRGGQSFVARKEDNDRKTEGALSNGESPPFRKREDRTGKKKQDSASIVEQKKKDKVYVYTTKKNVSGEGVID